MEKVKKAATQGLDTSKRVVANAEQFVQAVALLIVAGFTYYGLQNLELNDWAYRVVYVALVIIALRGAVEFFRFLDKK